MSSTQGIIGSIGKWTSAGDRPRIRILLTLSISLAACLAASFAQPQTSFENFPDAGDTLYYLTDEVPERIDVSRSGPKQFWNFSALQAPFLQSAVIEPASEGQFFDQYRDADMVAIDQDGNEKYYAINNARFDFLGGTKNYLKGDANHFSFFEGGLPEVMAEMRYNDDRNFETKYRCVLSRSEIPSYLVEQFDGIVESVKIEADMTRRLTADAWGTIYIPGGQYDVLRIKTEDQIDGKVYARTSADARWTLVEGSVAERLIGTANKTSFVYFAEDIAQPIATIYMSDNGKIADVTYRVHPDQSQFYRRPDPDQLIHAFPNPAIASVRLMLTNLDPGEYTIRFMNILGKPVMDRKCQVQGPQTVKIDLASFAKGAYLYTLMDANGKKLVSKRIFVLKP